MAQDDLSTGSGSADPWLLLLWAANAARNGEWESGLKAARDALEKDVNSPLWVPTLAALYAGLGDDLVQTGDRPSANLCFEAAYVLTEDVLSRELFEVFDPGKLKELLKDRLQSSQPLVPIRRCNADRLS